MAVELKVFVEPLPDDVSVDTLGADAFDRHYRQCQATLVALCRRLLCGRGDAEAIAQEAFVRAWMSFDRFSPSRPFWPWLATIARRLCIDHRRRLQRETIHAQIGLTWHDPHSTPSPEEAVETGEEYRSACAALRKLKPAEQRVITLRDVNGWSYEEIARFEGVTVESIRGSLKRARTSLRRSYASVAGGAPAALGYRWGNRLRARAHRLLNRCRPAPISPSLASLSTLQEALLGATALVVAFAGDGAPSVLMPPVIAVPASSSQADTSDSTPAAAQAAASPTPSRARPPHGPVSSETGPLTFLSEQLLADGGDAPEAVRVTGITSSPRAEEDGTIFMSAVVAHCPYPPCPALFRSSDGGATWRRLQATGFVGGDVLLPPSFPVDPRIFVAGPAGLQVSEDRGATFSSLTPVGGSAAVSPKFSDGDPRILVSASPVWEYRDHSPPGPAPLVLGPMLATGGIGFVPGSSSDVLVGGTRIGGDGRQQSIVFRCEGGLCHDSVVLDGLVGPPSLAVAPVDDVVFAWRGTVLFRSQDGGNTFEPTSLPAQGSISTVAFDPAGTVYVAVVPAAGAPAGGLFASTDNGRSFRALGADTVLTKGVTAVAAAGPNRLVAGPAPESGGGVQCSADGGMTWAPRCD